jgi:hypothetical protein
VPRRRPQLLQSPRSSRRPRRRPKLAARARAADERECSRACARAHTLFWTPHYTARCRVDQQTLSDRVCHQAFRINAEERCSVVDLVVTMPYRSVVDDRVSFGQQGFYRRCRVGRNICGGVRKRNFQLRVSNARSTHESEVRCIWLALLRLGSGAQ